MPKVILSFSMSLDGFVAGPDVNMAHAMGVGGERLHDWMFKGGASRDGAPPGAVVLGRRTFDIGLQHWNDTPYPVPSFVVTHRPEPKRQMKSAAFAFITDGVASAIAQAREAAGAADVIIMGAAIAQQALAAGLVDGLRLQLIPVLLCGGTPLFEHLGDRPIELDSGPIRPEPGVTHFDFSIRKQEF